VYYTYTTPRVHVGPRILTLIDDYVDIVEAVIICRYIFYVFLGFHLLCVFALPVYKKVL